MIDHQGWWLPNGDNYFGKFVTKPGKSNGFQVEHLEEAFKHVTDWRMALDIGAHCGFWTVPMAAKFTHVRAFEAAPDTHACLARNVSELANVLVYHAGVGAKAGTCEVCEDATRAGNTGSRFVRESGRVQMVAIDDFDWYTCGLMKIDVEGYEFQALQGARKTIERFWPVIIMETDKKFAKNRYGVEDDAAEKFLIGLGYKVVAHMRPDKVFVANP